MTLTTDFFLQRFPIFSDLDISIVESELLLCEQINPVLFWDNDVIRDSAISFLTAHNLLIDYYEQLNIGNQIVLNAIPDKFGTRDLSQTDFYNLTPYGIRYQRLRQQTLGIAFCVL